MALLTQSERSAFYFLFGSLLNACVANKNVAGKNNTCITCPAVLQCISVNIDNVIYSLLQSEV